MSTIDDKIAAIISAVKDYPQDKVFTVNMPHALFMRITKAVVQSKSARRSWREYRRRYPGNSKADWLRWKWGMQDWLVGELVKLDRQQSH